jgi:hypothetical protein
MPDEELDVTRMSPWLLRIELNREMMVRPGRAGQAVQGLQQRRPRSGVMRRCSSTRQISLPCRQISLALEGCAERLLAQPALGSCAPRRLC